MAYYYQSAFSCFSTWALSPYHIAALHKRENIFVIPNNIKGNVCTAQMSSRNTKCIKCVMQFLLNNSILQKWHPKWYPKSYNVWKSLYNVQHQRTTFYSNYFINFIAIISGTVFFNEWIEMQILCGNNRGRIWIRPLYTSASGSVSKLRGKLETEGDVRLLCEL